MFVDSAGVLWASFLILVNSCLCLSDTVKGIHILSSIVIIAASFLDWKTKLQLVGAGGGGREQRERGGGYRRNKQNSRETGTELCADDVLQ